MFFKCLEIAGNLIARAMAPVPFQVRLLVEFRAVLRGIDGDEHPGGELFAAHATDDVQGLAGGELGIHAGRGNAHALLSAGLAELMELGTVNEKGLQRALSRRDASDLMQP